METITKTPKSMLPMKVQFEKHTWKPFIHDSKIFGFLPRVDVEIQGRSVNDKLFLITAFHDDEQIFEEAVTAEQIPTVIHFVESGFILYGAKFAD